MTDEQPDPRHRPENGKKRGDEKEIVVNSDDDYAPTPRSPGGREGQVGEVGPDDDWVPTPRSPAGETQGEP